MGFVDEEVDGEIDGGAGDAYNIGPGGGGAARLESHTLSVDARALFLAGLTPTPTTEAPAGPALPRLPSIHPCA